MMMVVMMDGARFAKVCDATTGRSHGLAVSVFIICRFPARCVCVFAVVPRGISENVADSSRRAYTGKMKNLVTWLQDNEHEACLDGGVAVIFPLPNDVLMQFLASRTTSKNKRGELKQNTAANIGGFVNAYNFFHREVLSRDVDPESYELMKVFIQGSID
jgi:hypothetical protein